MKGNTEKGKIQTNKKSTLDMKQNIKKTQQPSINTRTHTFKQLSYPKILKKEKKKTQPTTRRSRRSRKNCKFLEPKQKHTPAAALSYKTTTTIINNPLALCMRTSLKWVRTYIFILITKTTNKTKKLFVCETERWRKRELLKSGEWQKQKIKQVFIILPACASVAKPINLICVNGRGIFFKSSKCLFNKMISRKIFIFFYWENYRCWLFHYSTEQVGDEMSLNWWWF